LLSTAAAALGLPGNASAGLRSKLRRLAIF
jgi:hypothetical protein